MNARCTRVFCFSALTVVVALGMGCGSSNIGGGGASTDASAPSADAARADAASPTGGPAIGDLEDRVASSICSALFRCCDDDLATYFAAYRGNELLADFRDRLPPDAQLTAQDCPALVHDMIDIVPIGDWVRQVQAGRVPYDPVKASSCLAALDNATCGAPARAALYDSTCFGFAPPQGGADQRSWVARASKPGDSCAPIRDGIGAVFYGTCDPHSQFCCYANSDAPGSCAMPYDGDGKARTGSCATAPETDQACSATTPIAVCRTGSACDPDTQTCMPPVTTPLAVGDACADDNFNQLGSCTDSWCDYFGDKKCVAPRDLGQSCDAGYECKSGACKVICVENDLCTGVPDPAPDAGPGDSDASSASDAGPADAGVSTAAGETCASAGDLVAASTGTPYSGYLHAIDGAMGASNDYNALDSSGMQPGCAFVGDASGLDVVYTVTLDPGDELDLRLELAGGKRAGVYMVDSCPVKSWPDYDHSGKCGNNEYGAAFCGPVGCEAAKLAFKYPDTETAPKQFWVVIDQLDGTDAASFHLDWKKL